MRFQNPDLRHVRPSRWDVFRWSLLRRLTGQSERKPPGQPPERVVPNLDMIHAADDRSHLTWIGHASMLARMGGVNLLIDPVFAERVGLLYPRYAAPGLVPEQLPPVDVVLITHNHYDHLDASSIAALPRTATIVAPQKLGRWFLPYGFARVIELRWWESIELGPLRVTFVPARHWSRRTLFDTNASLWGGYVIEAGDVRIYHAGDTAEFDGFAEIGERFPGLGAACLPIGGYAPEWFMQHSHFTPEAAGEAFRRLGARRLIPIHWGSFQLSDEPLREPVLRLQDWWQRQHDLADRSLHRLAIGETLPLSG